MKFPFTPLTHTHCQDVWIPYHLLNFLPSLHYSASCLQQTDPIHSNYYSPKTSKLISLTWAPPIHSTVPFVNLRPLIQITPPVLFFCQVQHVWTLKFHFFYHLINNCIHTQPADWTNSSSQIKFSFSSSKDMLGAYQRYGLICLNKVADNECRSLCSQIPGEYTHAQRSNANTGLLNNLGI